MEQSDHTTGSRKGKHLTHAERGKIEAWLQDGNSAYRIAKKMGRSLNTILSTIRNGMTKQIKCGKTITVYLADHSQSVYESNRKNCGKPYKLLACGEFIQDVCTAMEKSRQEKESWSIDASVGYVRKKGKYAQALTVCTKTLYNYTDMGLLPFDNMDLPQKLKRNTKRKRVRENRKNLGNSIDQRPESVDKRESFGDWEIDTVRGTRSGKGSALLTIAERQSRMYIIRKIPDATAESVTLALKQLRDEYGACFSKVFRTITADNGSEFAELSELEQYTDTKVYFTHPYSSFEKGTNERHNGLLRRFIPKGRLIDGFNENQIGWIEDWINGLPRKILGYATPEDFFEAQLDKIYTTARTAA